MGRKLHSEPTEDAEVKTVKVVKNPALIVLQGRTSNAAKKLWKKAAMGIALAFMGLTLSKNNWLLKWDEPIEITVDTMIHEARITDAFLAINATCVQTKACDGHKVIITPCKEYYRQLAKNEKM